MRKLLLLTLALLVTSVTVYAQVPSEAAPTPPERAAADVISIFSDAYDDIVVGTFSADFDDSDIADTTIDGNAVKKISFTNFLGVDFNENRQDMSGMTHFHIDFWTAETNLDGKVFNSKFSNWAGGDAKANALELNINTGTDPAIQTGTWVSVDVPFSSFTPVNGDARADIAQFLITSNLGVVFVDNIYAYNDGSGTGGGGGGNSGGTGDGTELVSNGDFEAGDDGSWYGTGLNIQTEGDNSFNFADVETAGDAFAVNLSQRGLSLTQGESYVLTFDASGSGNGRTMVVGIGQSAAPFEATVETITLADTMRTYNLLLEATTFGGSDDRVIFDMGADTGVVVIDNVSLQAEEGSGGGTSGSTVPEVAAPTPPERAAGDVISLFSDAYTDIEVGTFSADFDDSDISDTTVAGNAVKKIDFGNFIGVDFQNNRQDMSGMTHFHIDFWTAETNLDGKVFNPKFSQWGGTAGEVSALELDVNTGTDPAIQTGTWVSVDVPFSGFRSVNGDARDDIAQFLITSNLGVVFVDNIYAYNEDGSGGGDDDLVGDGNELVVNGDFEAGDDGSWYGNALNIQEDGGNSFNFADVEAAGDAFSVNLSQRGISLTDGQPYILSFDASSAGDGRTMVVGVGQSADPFAAVTELVTLVDSTVSYSVVVTPTGFGGDDDRVLFDMGADTGVVVIDNVSLQAAIPSSNEQVDDTPSEFVLNQNYPNPFNPSTNISFNLPQAERVTLKVYDMLGREVAVLADRQLFNAGTSQITFNARNLSSGIYIYQLQTSNVSLTRKMTLIK